jgi:DNA-binding IclR family transcriptional regulator
MENADESSWRELKTVRTATTVVDALATLDGAGVTELAAHLELSKSSVHAHLATLREAGYLTKKGEEYRLSYQFLLFGEYVRNSSPLFEFGRSKANHLAQETGHYSHLFTEERGLGINVYESRGEKASDYEYQSRKLQQREPLHVTASGKVVLAHLPEERVQEIVREHGLARMTGNTITDEAKLLEELESVRENGFAINDEEEIDGFRAVAAPIRVRGDEILGSISVSGPTAFFSEEKLSEEISEKVMNAAGMIEVDINMSDWEL